jgi:hypothetical protein
VRRGRRDAIVVGEREETKQLKECERTVRSFNSWGEDVRAPQCGGKFAVC